jgi:hypothetical protein
MILQKHYGYAPLAVTEYYCRHIDAYFSLFNLCRKKAEKKQVHANTDFVHFFLEGQLETFRQFQDEANTLLRNLGFLSQLDELLQTGKINLRQNAVLHHLFSKGAQVTKKALSAEAFYKALYDEYHPKTRERDLKQLAELGLISIEGDQIQLAGLSGGRLLSHDDEGKK